MGSKKPDAAQGTEEPATEPIGKTNKPPADPLEYAQWILKQNRERNEAAGGNKNGR